MNGFILTIVATLVVSITGLIGTFSFFFKKELPSSVTRLMIAFSSGALLGETFLHLFPEGTESMSVRTFGAIVIATLIAYFILEKTLHWHHHNDKAEHHDHDKAVGYMSLIGDCLHNFIDGVVIASAFAVNPALGVSTTFAIILHEIPQELGNFAILLHSGFKKDIAVLASFTVGLVAILGGVLGYIAVQTFSGLSAWFLPIAAGGFLYISVSDLMPSIKHESKGKEWGFALIAVIVGVLAMTLVG